MAYLVKPNTPEEWRRFLARDMRQPVQQESESARIRQAAFAANPPATEPTRVMRRPKRLDLEDTILLFAKLEAALEIWIQVPSNWDLERKVRDSIRGLDDTLWH